jgi:VacB/RNase II family 3'-5' exoribonuclease
MIERGLEPDFSSAALAEAKRLGGPPMASGDDVRDLRELLWCSIDNDDSRDLDQLTVAEPLASGGARMRVAVADVGAAVDPSSAMDDHALANTASIYTPPRVFPMLPERLSTDLTSLVPGEDRLAVVIEMRVDGDGASHESHVCRARVRNRAKLTYRSVGAWLEGQDELPALIAAIPGLAENLRLQDQVAHSLEARRHEQGALELESIEPRAEFVGDEVRSLVSERRNRARELIENVMIAANGAIARFLAARGAPLLRRVVRSPERWPRIVEIARAHGERLPSEPDAKALHGFLVRRRAADPVTFPDLSLAIIKLLGRGEYVVGYPGQEVAGHFGLAASDYTHSTAPNRRYPDLVTQRVLQASLAKRPPPYSRDQLEALATHCTAKGNDIQKIERLMRKAAAACLLAGQVGHEFDGIVTGASEKGTWVRVFEPPVEGRVEQGSGGLDVGDRVRVKLIGVDPARGHIDFARVRHLGVTAHER